MFSFEWTWRSFRNNWRINQKVSQVRACCSQWPLAYWDCGFESHRGHGCLSVAECFTLSGSLCVGPITCTEESYRLWCVVECDLETSWMRRPWPTGGCCARNKQTRLLLLEAESTLGPWCGRKDINKKFQSRHRESNPRPSGYATARPIWQPVLR